MCGGAAAAAAAALGLLATLVGGGVSVAGSQHDGGLCVGVVAPPRAPPDHLHLRCSPAPALTPVSAPAPALRRYSWLIITDVEEQQVSSTLADGELQLEVTAERSGARVVCRTHAGGGGGAVHLSPPLTVWPHDAVPAPPPAPGFSPHRVHVAAGAGAAGEAGVATTRAGSSLDVRCSSLNLPLLDDHLYYLHAVLQAARGDSERELFSVLVRSARRGAAAGRVRLGPADTGARLVCLARWFSRGDTRYGRPRTLRSLPLTLVVEPDMDHQRCIDPVWLWSAVGATGLGGAALVAALVLAAAGCRRRARHRAQQSAETDVGRPCVGVVSMSAARSLVAANVKLAPSSAAPPAPPPAPDHVEYVNLRDLHSGNPYL